MASLALITRALYLKKYVCSQSCPLETDFLSFHPCISNEPLCVWLLETTLQAFPTFHSFHKKSKGCSLGVATSLPQGVSSQQCWGWCCSKALPGELCQGTPLCAADWVLSETLLLLHQHYTRIEVPPPIFISCVTVNLALVGRKSTFTVYL